MPTELYNRDGHICLSFTDLVDDEADAVQANQFLVIDNNHCALIDPGGNMTYHALFMAISRFVPARDLDMILASHADPDIVASLNKWMVGSTAKVYVSRI
jgi:flavorubredoxin